MRKNNNFRKLISWIHQNKLIHTTFFSYRERRGRGGNSIHKVLSITNGSARVPRGSFLLGPFLAT